MSATIEMVTFKLNSDASEKDFLATNPALESWVSKQPGFEYRSLSQKQDGQWVDIVYWQTAEDAQKAGTLFMQANETQAMMSFIDKDSVDMQHMPVLSARLKEMAVA